MGLVKAKKGIYISNSLKTIVSGLGTDELEKELSQKTVEELANEWKVRMLKQMIFEEFEGGYLLLWEE